MYYEMLFLLFSALFAKESEYRLYKLRRIYTDYLIHNALRYL